MVIRFPQKHLAMKYGYNREFRLLFETNLNNYYNFGHEFAICRPVTVRCKTGAAQRTLLDRFG